MDTDEPTSPQSDILATTANSSQPLATQNTRRTIHDYFKPLCSEARQSSFSEGSLMGEEFTTSSQPNDAPELFPKKLKITANNGHTIMIRQPGRKRVKREETLHDAEEAGHVSHPRRHHSRGKLRILPSFPLDVIFEIFSHLLPIDLLHLARATRDIRAVLFHRSASYVWKCALANVPNLPPCPNDVPLPQWASLVFDTFCQNCLASNVRSVNFDLRVRYCNKCVKIKLLEESTFDVKKNPKASLILQGVPFSRWNDRFDVYCTIADKDKFLEEYDAHPTATFMEERIQNLKLRAEHAKKCKAWYNSILDRRGAELDEIREKRAELIREKLTAAGFAEELEFLDEFAMGVCAIRPWPSIIYFKDHPHVKIAKPLTEKAWSKMEDEMIDYMKEISVQIEKDDRARLLRRRRVAFHTAYVNWRCLSKNLGRHPPNKFMPGPADLLDDPQIKKMIGVPGDLEFDAKIASCFLEEFFDLEDFVVSFREQNIVRLFQEADYIGIGQRRFSQSDAWPILKPDDYFSLTPSYCKKETVLKSAVFVFRCNSTFHWRYISTRIDEEGDDHHEAECLWYPDFFFHPCTSMVNLSWEETRTKDNSNLSLEKQFHSSRRDPWDVGRLKFDEKASRVVRNLLEAAALDVTTTVEKMDVLNHRFVCLKCTFGARCDGVRKVRVWSWREAVQHCLKTHFGDSRVTWECLYPEDTEKALVLQAAEHTKRGYPPPNACALWKCMRCRDTSSEWRRMTMAELRAHFLRKPKHGSVDDIDEGENILYYKARDYTPKELPPVRMIPGAHKPMKPPLTEFQKWMLSICGHSESEGEES